MGIWQSLWKFIDEFMRDVTAFGGFFFTGLVVLATFALGYYLLSFKLILGFVILIALVVLIRMVYFRERPNRVSHTNFLERIDASSFPSLHSARVVFMVLVLGTAWPILPWLVFVGFVAVMVVYSRIYLRKHDWIDVTVGAVLGGVVFVVVNRLLGSFL